jgi:hypothetical protein
LFCRSLNHSLESNHVIHCPSLIASFHASLLSFGFTIASPFFWLHHCIWRPTATARLISLFTLLWYAAPGLLPPLCLGAAVQDVWLCSDRGVVLLGPHACHV